MHILSILLPFIFTLFSQQKQTAKPKIIALSHATLIDGTGAEPLYDSLILIQNGIIIAVGPREKIDIPNGSEWLDYAGRFIVPGLIDMHVHLDEVSTPEAFPLFGVTAVRDVGSRLVTIQRLRAQEKAGNTRPRIYWMGRNIDEGKPSWWGAVAVKDKSEVPNLIADMDKQGVDGVKLYVNSGPEVSKSVIDEAHKRFLPVTGHLKRTLPSQAVRMRIDNLEHVSTLFNEFIPSIRTMSLDFRTGFIAAAKVDMNSPSIGKLIKILKANHVAVTPTLCAAKMPVSGQKHAEKTYYHWSTTPSGWINDWKQPYWSFISTQNWRPTDFVTAGIAFSKYQEMVRKLNRAGVTIVAGTDTPAPWVLPGAGLIHELELLVECGLTPMQAIQSATSKAAALLGKSKEIGTIQVGRRADFVVLDYDPSKDIQNLRSVREVYMNGRAIDREALMESFRSVKPTKR